MKNLLISATGVLSPDFANTADMLTASKLGDKELACVSSNGKAIVWNATTLTADNAKADYRGQTFQFIQGRGAGMNPHLGIVINPFNFSYTIKPYVAKVAKVVKMGYSVGLNTTSSIILAADCVAANIGRIVGIRVTLMNFPKLAYSQEVPYYEVSTQIKANDTVALVLARLKTKLDVLFAKLGNSLSVSSPTNSTVYYGFDFTAAAGFNFTVKGMGLAENAIVAVTTAVVLGTGLGSDQILLETEMTTRDGNNASFHSDQQLYTEESEIVAAEEYDVCIIETVMDPQYEIFQDHINMAKRQWILVPKGGTIGTAEAIAGTETVTRTVRVAGTGIYQIADILDSIKAANR